VAIKRRHALLVLFPRVFPATLGVVPAKQLKRFNKTKSLGEKWEDKWTGWFLKFFLWIFSKAFDLSEDFRENIKGYKANYVFKTETCSVVVSATFKDGDMEVHEGDIDEWDAMIIFRDAAALRATLKSLLLSGNLDILELMLANKVEVHGNVNCIFKFIFMVRDLTHSLGIG